MASNLPSSVSEISGIDGLPALHVSTDVCEATIQLHGAHLTSFVPADGDEMLWMSSLAQAEGPTAIRGGVPICFPWFGSGVSGQATPSHGFARLAAWRLVDAYDDEGSVTLTFELNSNDVADLDNKHAWPRGLSARYAVRLGAEVHLMLTATNDGDDSVVMEEALHTYLRVPNIADTAIDGDAGERYLDQLSGRTETVSDSITFPGEVDLVLDSTRDLTVTCGGTPLVTVEREGSHSIVIWNPHIDKARALRDVPDDAWPEFVCVEAANVKDNAVTLQPDHSHTMTAIYRPAAR